MINERKDPKTTPHLSVLTCIAAGFELVTAHWGLILIPFLLDLFYWLGPRLSSRPLLVSLADWLVAQEATQVAGEQLATVAGQTNLFTALTVPLVGVPALMSSFISPANTPLPPNLIELSNPLSWLLTFIGLTLAGLVLTAFYYGLVAYSVRAGLNRPLPVAIFLRWLPAYGLRLFILVVSLLLAALIIYVPLTLAATLVAVFSAGLAQFVMTMGLALLLWLVFYLSFSIHGILLWDRPVFLSMFESMMLVRSHLRPALVLVLLSLFVRTLLGWLWLLADMGSWLTLISLAGYAFISTALAAAMFVFYRDRVEFVRVVKGEEIIPEA